jgi:pimeloyl-ACP methyl ester carboxylesterase
MQKTPAGLEYEVQGQGEPVLLIHGSHIADAFKPLMPEPALAGYQLIRYIRRGFATSAKHSGPFSLSDQAKDAESVLQHLGIARAHIVGHSYGAATALQLAVQAPERVATLSLLEPPIAQVPSGEESMAAFAAPDALYQAGDGPGAVNEFLKLVLGEDWQERAEAMAPGAAAQAKGDARTFFEVELPALPGWEFGEEQARAIAAPAVYVLGSESGPFFAEGADLLSSWLPNCRTVTIHGVNHGLQMQDPKAVAEAIAGHLRANPIN